MRYLPRKSRPRPSTRPKRRRPQGRGFPTIPDRKLCPSPSPSRFPRRSARRVESRSPDVGWSHCDALRRRGVSLSRLRSACRQGCLRPGHFGIGGRGPSPVSGGPDDIVLTASHGDMRLNMHTARFYDVTGTVGVRRSGRAIVYSTPNPFLFSGARPAPDRRRHLQDRRRHHDQLPAAQA